MIVADYDAIPDELKERDQWLTWDDEHPHGKRPLWGDDEAVSWTDPDDWHSFEEAVEKVSERASWGIGYVFAYSNDDYPRGLYGCLDIDGCLDEDGRKKDWVPSISGLSDTNAYMEISPSGTGVHIPLVGFEPPDWWENSHFSDDEHEGVEAYGQKFCTFTGDELPGSGDEVAEIDVSGWLAEVYEQINGEPPRTPDDYDESGDRGGSDVDLRIHDVISSKYTEGENHSHPFHPSGTGTNFRVHEGGETFYCWRHKAGGNAAHLIGMEQGIISCGEWEGSGLDSDTWREIFDAGREAGYDIPEPMGKRSTPTADGGTAAAKTGAPAPGDDDRGSPLKPGAVIARAGYDPEEDSLRDLKASEAAFAIDQILGETDEWHFLVIDDDTEDLYTFDHEAGVWRRNGERRLKQICRQAMGSEDSKNIHGEVVYKTQGNPNLIIERDELGAPDGTIATRTGLLDLLERETEPLRPEHRALNRIEAAYDPEADYEGTRWMEFLETSVRDGDLAKLQEYAGYCLWHHAQPFGKALFLVGPTDSGKGTFLKAITQVLGDENVANESLYGLLQTRWGSARIFGKMANIRNEVTPGGLKNIQLFKELTGGGDTLSAEYKGKDKFEFQVTQKFLFSTNQMPEVEDVDTAFLNRLLFVVFPETVPEEEQDKQLLEKFEEERDAILSWMLDGLDRLMEQERFTGERDYDQKETIMAEHGDATDRFVQNVVEITGDADDVIHKGDLYEVFVRFNDFIGHDPVVQQKFTKSLKGNKGVSDGRSRRLPDGSGPEHVYTGIRIDERACKELQADVPRYATSDDDAGGASHQSRIDR